MGHYDFIIIGGGASAFAAAIRANELGAKTALINAGLPLGGTCVNVGCVPSKTLLWAGELLHAARSHGIPGIDLEVKNVDFARVVEDELALVSDLREDKYGKVLEHLESVTHIEGRATFRSPHEVVVGRQELRAAQLLVATGSTAIVPPIDGITDVGFITHIEALQLQKLPKELVVVGAGALGLEFAQLFARFGTKVTVLQRAARIFPSAEQFFTDKLTDILQREGITIHTAVTVKRAYRDGSKKILVFEREGRQEEVAGDEVLLASGKRPNTATLGLDTAGVVVDERQAVTVNEHMQTSASHIYAAGDVTNLRLRLETTAGREGTLAAENALRGTKHTIDYSTVPYTVFTDPQLAGVGMTEEEQMEKLGVCACKTVSFADVPKAIIMRRTEGYLKMAIHPETKEIMGVHILAPHAGDLIAQGMMLVKNKNTIDDVINSLPMFPTLSEAYKVAALSFTKDIKNLSCCI
jgi:mercuric reductase